MESQHEDDRSKPLPAAGGVASIANSRALLAHGLAGPRELALRVANAGLAACDPGPAVERLVSLEGNELIVDGRCHRLEPSGRVVVLGSGKATMKIGVALEKILGERLSGGTIVVRHGEATNALKRIELLEAAHPLPDKRSVAAARSLLKQAGELGPEDLVIACFTGGSSALTCLPPPGVSETDKRELHRVLLGSGISISEVNTVRKQVSDFKAGRLALAASPASLINLGVSDVAGDALDALTDPSVQDSSTVADALDVLHRNDLWDEIPASVRRHLSDPERGSPDLSGVDIQSTLVVTGATACEAMTSAGAEAGAAASVVSTNLEAEAVEMGRILADLAHESLRGGRASGDPIVFVGCGGESTVRLGACGEFGLGGPNQEAALSAAIQLDGVPVAIALLDTDGSDGGTDIAGAIADGSTAARAREAGIDLRSAVASHRSGEIVAALGDGIETGPTYTNVNDLFVVAVGEPRQ